MIRSSKKTLSKARMIAALDKDCREQVVEARDRNCCQRCGQTQGNWDDEIKAPVRIQWAHVHTREYHVTRWEPDNSLALCSRCHVWFDNHKVLSYEWFRKLWPQRWQNIQNVLQSRTKAGTLFIRTLYEELKADPPSKSQYMDIPLDTPF